MLEQVKDSFTIYLPCMYYRNIWLNGSESCRLSSRICFTLLYCQCVGEYYCKILFKIQVALTA